MRQGTGLALSLLLGCTAWADEAPLDPYGPSPPPVAPPSAVAPPMVPAPTPPGAVPPYYAPPIPPPADALDSNLCDEGCDEGPPARPPSVEAPYTPLPPPPPLARPDNRRVRLLAGGITLFATSWVSATLDAAFGTTPYVIIPLAGPVIATVDYQRNYVHTSYVQLESALLVFDAVAQTAGLVMTIIGAATKSHAPGATRMSWAGTGVKGTF